ncbi:hypothetical protein [Amaricoccus solimangrovi]|uniref:hypothetical protein n=1 Tax=Amaricoccus solimangrovi TaxID=2589815 RepID=UPI0015E40A4D|nr:hypothetical protein [Amaricoccus solimangrovi]
MHVSFEHNLRGFERDLSDLARRQLPFATASALNETARAIADNAGRALEKRLDRPTPFTRRGLAVFRAGKARLWADVFFRDRQAGYLAWAERGGERKPARKAIPVPVGIRLDRHGGMPRNALARARARADTFAPAPGTRLPAGLYQRLKAGRLRMLAAFEPVAHYTPRLRFGVDAEKTARAYFPIALERAFRRAWATARR